MIPFERFGQGTRPLIFAHANGYPPKAYQALLNELGFKFQIYAPYLRALWPKQDADLVRDWRLFARDLAHFVDEQQLHNACFVGHSVGAMSGLIAALDDPELFADLVLIDPVLFPPWLARLWKVFVAFGVDDKVHPYARGALKRRQRFDSAQQMYDIYRRKAVFANINDTNLRAYVDAIGVDDDDGAYRLTYPAEWESRVYLTGALRDLDTWRRLHTLKPRLLVLRGAKSDTFFASAARELRRHLIKASVVDIENAGHLVALEQPNAVAQHVLDFFRG